MEFALVENVLVRLEAEFLEEMRKKDGEHFATLLYLPWVPVTLIPGHVLSHPLTIAWLQTVVKVLHTTSTETQWQTLDLKSDLRSEDNRKPRRTRQEKQEKTRLAGQAFPLSLEFLEMHIDKVAWYTEVMDEN